MTEKMNIMEILLQSGFIVQFVLLALLAASILSWAIILQKKKTFEAVQRANKEFEEYFKNNQSLADIFERANLHPESTVGHLFKKGYLELTKIKEKLKSAGMEAEYSNYIRTTGVRALERSLKQGVNDSNSRVESRLPILASIGSISPFIGLFGTVWGIIDSFTGLATGGGNIEAIAPGIAEALVATAVGLAAAIPAVWAYNHFSSRLNEMNAEMETFGQEFINLIERSLLISREQHGV
ncbi:MAG: protein TolQ [Bacteriovoracaceae bacterium]